MGVNSHLCADFLNTLYFYNYFFFLKSLEALQADQINSTQGYAEKKTTKNKKHTKHNQQGRSHQLCFE